MTSYHVEHIKAYLKSQGFTDQELIDDLTDHLATEIEFSMDSEKLDFATSFEKAEQKLLPDSPYQLERDLKILTTPKHNTMIKKIAYIGGYFSAICFTLSLLFGILSFQNDYQVVSRKEVIEAQYLNSNIEGELTPESMSKVYNSYYEVTSELKMKSLNQLEISQFLLIVSILLFSTTYLPYRFYDGYNKSQLELTA